MSLYLGIDGGGSHLRVVVTDAHLNALGQARGETANPSSIGHAEAARRLGAAIAEALAHANCPPGAIRAAGVGIAGASAEHSAGWLCDTLRASLPAARLALSSDIEIALVGAHGARHGALLLAGTGSVALAVDGRTGRRAQVGGWGYLLGDEGGGYWLGLSALRAIIRSADGLGAPTALQPALLAQLNLPTPRALIGWLYGATPRQREVAGLAPLVLATAQDSDPAAREIVEQGAQALARLARAAREQAGDPALALAFAGGLLAELNPLSRRVLALCDMAALPPARYPPVIGAALLARLSCEQDDPTPC